MIKLLVAALFALFLMGVHELSEKGTTIFLRLWGWLMLCVLTIGLNWWSMGAWCLTIPLLAIPAAILHARFRGARRCSRGG